MFLLGPVIFLLLIIAGGYLYIMRKNPAFWIGLGFVSGFAIYIIITFSFALTGHNFIASILALFYPVAFFEPFTRIYKWVMSMPTPEQHPPTSPPETDARHLK